MEAGIPKIPGYGIVFAPPVSMKNTFPAAGLAFLLGFSACSPKMMPGISAQPALPPESGRVITAQNQFAFRLFQETLSRENRDVNNLISPMSLFQALSMVYNGAAGSTSTAMQQALGLTGISTGLLNQTNRALITNLPRADTAVDISVANAIWYRNTGVQPLPDFIKTNTQYYQALIKEAGFSPNTVKDINDWVAAQTNRKIKTIVQTVSADDVMYLVNAVYFKGSWTNPFDPGTTREGDFTTKQGSIIQAPFMRQDKKLNYLQNDTLQMVELPYGKGDFSMYILLPGENVSLSRLISQMNEATWSYYLGQMDSVKINLRMPKWKYSYAVNDYKPELAALGMGVAFTATADFSEMYPKQSPVQISKVVHKTFIEVNEEGTEAAAATSIGVSVTSMPINPTPVMDVNRPFIYLILDKNSGSVLFIGQVNNPAEE